MSLFVVRQIAAGGLDSNFSYVICAASGHDAAIVDPCGSTRLIREAVADFPGAVPKYILLTHGHHDHVEGVDEVLAFFKAPVAAHSDCPRKTDIRLSDGQRLPFGGSFIECLHTPGHSKDSVVYRLGDDSAIFTGDTLFIGWCGYCEASGMFKSMRRIAGLPDSNMVWPGHDYGKVPHATLGEEKRSNPYLRTTDFGEFRRILKDL